MCFSSLISRSSFRIRTAWYRGMLSSYLERLKNPHNYGSRSILCIGSKPLFIRRLSMDLSLVIGGIVMIFLISLEEATLQGSKVFSQFYSFVFES